MKNILIMALALLAVPFTSGAQAQLTTRKVKIEDFSEKVTKIVLSGNIFYDSTLKEAVKAGWTISPYEFCTMDEFESLKTDVDYYFLIKVKGQFRKESAPGIEFLSLLKGGPEAGDGIGKMLDLITFPYAVFSICRSVNPARFMASHRTPMSWTPRIPDGRDSRSKPSKSVPRATASSPARSIICRIWRTISAACARSFSAVFPAGLKNAP